MQFNAGCGYSAIVTHRSALANFIILPGYSSLSNHPLVKRFMKGVFNLKPTLPRYTKTWDASQLVKFLKSLYPNSDLSLKLICLKTASLLTLLSGQRIHTVHLIQVQNIDLTENAAICYIKDLTKCTKPSNPNKPLRYLAFPEDESLCPVKCLTEYIERRKIFLKNEEGRLFFTHAKPHHIASKDTVARWVREAMRFAGINTDVFKPHSIRSASTSKAKAKGVPMDVILRHGTWSQSSTFFKFYYREIEELGADNEKRNEGFERNLLS